MCIVAATDFSPSSCDVADVAAALARARGEELVLVHVQDGTSFPQPSDELRLAVEARRIAGKGGVQPRTRREKAGNIGARLAEVADEERAALLVIGAQGEGMRSGFGSVAAAVLRACTCPLLVVRHAERLFPARAGELRAIVSLALDETDGPLTEALALLASAGDYDADFVHYQVLPDDESDHAARMQAKRIAAEDVRAELSLAGLPPGVCVGTVAVRDGKGEMRRDVCSLTSAQDADLIVCGSHHRRGMRRIREGSIAEQIVTHAPVSVLVARAPHTADAASAGAVSWWPKASND